MISSGAPGRDRDKAAQWDAAAGGWDAQAPQIRTWLHEATAAMLNMADIRPGMHVLDVAAGAGDQTDDIARRVGGGGSVLATDISPHMLAAAAANLRTAGHGNVRTLVADGEALGLDGANFDAAACRLGLMFLADPLRGLQAVRRALRPGGRFCAMVFSEPRMNPCIGIVVSIVARHAGLPLGDPYQPGRLMSLGKPGQIEELFVAAGFVDIRVARIDAPFRVPSADDYLRFIRTAAGPVMAMVDHIPEQARPAAWTEIADALAGYAQAGAWQAPTELLLAAGAR